MAKVSKKPSGDWFSRLSKKAQAEYIKTHPRSKYAKNRKAAAAKPLPKTLKTSHDAKRIADKGKIVGMTSAATETKRKASLVKLRGSIAALVAKIKGMASGTSKNRAKERLATLRTKATTLRATPKVSVDKVKVVQTRAKKAQPKIHKTTQAPGRTAPIKALTAKQRQLKTHGDALKAKRAKLKKLKVGGLAHTRLKGEIKTLKAQHDKLKGTAVKAPAVKRKTK